MGYYCNKEIASVVEPSEIVLANSPNFVVFSSKKDSRFENSQLETSIEVVNIGVKKTNLRIEIKEKQTGNAHKFHSTYDPLNISDDTFYVVSTESHFIGDDTDFLEVNPLILTAQNIRNCLMKNSFMRNNFEITMDIFRTTTEAETFKKNIFEENTIRIKSKGFGPQYDFSIDIVYDNVDEITSDYSISLKNLDFSNLVITDFQIQIEGHHMRAALWDFLCGDYEKNDEKYFKVILPQAGVRSVDEARLETLKNLWECLQRDYAVKTNLSIYLNEKDLSIDCSYVSYNSDCVLDDIVPQTNLITVKKGNTVDCLKISTSKISDPTSSDSIDYGTGKYQIELDIYTDHDVFPGTSDKKVSLGNYMTTLSKSYFGKPLWFDLSTLLSKKATYSSAFLTELEPDKTHEDFKLWSNANTITEYRFVAKRTDGIIHAPFYYSFPLYALNGYNYTLDPLKLAEDTPKDCYILDFSQNFSTDNFAKVKPLTTNFARTHIKGQRQYFNYIHRYKAPASIIEEGDNLSPSIGLHYKIYTQSGSLIGTCTQQGQESDRFYKVNTALLQLDQFLPMYKDKTVGRIDVYLCRWHKNESLGIDEPEVIISTPLSFRILPEVLNEVNDFAFLNQLGGWDTMNFGGDFSSDFKTASSTIYKTLQPGFTLQTEIESVAMKTVQEQKVVQTSPITKQTVEWLRQMSASPAVYELSTKRYILIDDMSLKYNSTDELYQVEMKYHYTDTFK